MITQIVFGEGIVLPAGHKTFDETGKKIICITRRHQSTRPL